MIVDYKTRKKEVLDSYESVEQIISELKDYAKKIQLPDPTERLEPLLKDVRSKAEKVKADKFNLMIAGESKSGKSTFINAYLGVELLPMDVKQCTSSIVEIKYGKTFLVKATYADGKTKEIVGDKEVREFLKKNAALDDEYRDIPVPSINAEILVKAGKLARKKGRNISISNADIEEMLAKPEIIAANIHNLPDYNKRIKAYIESRKNRWYEIVTKIEIMFPFEESLHGIEIIDSPGVCARGGVADITSNYIEQADAIIFLKPVIGQSLESTQFSQFMENASVERNKNALFLVFTHIATMNQADLRRLEEEAIKQFSSKINKRNILFVDSKAKLYANQFSKVENIEKELRRINAQGKLDSFVLKAYFDTQEHFDTNGFLSNGDETDFIKKLHEISRFNQIDEALETFGRKAHYILLSALLDSIIKINEKLLSDMGPRIKMFEQKAEDPTELAKKIAEVKQELEIIQNKLHQGVERVVRRFCGDEGIIRNLAEKETKDFLENVEKIERQKDGAFNDLESLSFKKIDRFKDLTESLQNRVVEEFDQELIHLSDNSTISFVSLKPDFTEETFKEILKSTKAKATKREAYEEGITFKDTRYRPVYMRDKHFDLVKNSIITRLNDIKNDLIENMEDFVENIRSNYIKELAKNADAKKDELDAIMEAKTTAEQTLKIIKELHVKTEFIITANENAKKIKGGILMYVQQ